MAALVDTTYTTKDTLKVRLGEGDIREEGSRKPYHSPYVTVDKDERVKSGARGEAVRVES